MSHPVGRLRVMFTPADRALAELAASQHSVFSLTDARREFELVTGETVQLSHAQIDVRVAKLWTPLYEGVFRMPGAVPTWKGDLMAACLATKGGLVAVSHRAGAEMYELPGARRLVEISCERWLRTRKPGLVVHESTRLADADIKFVEGIPVSTPERLILELAGIWPGPDFVEKVIQAARRKRLITYESTVATFERLRRRGVRGVKAMAIALERWNPDSRPTQSDMETMLLQILRDHGFPEPTPQFQVLDEFGNLVATCDLGLGRWKIVLEYDSDQEHSDEFQIARDERRRNEITAAGYTVLVARKHDLRTGGHVLVDQIRRIARRHAS